MHSIGQTTTQRAQAAYRTGISIIVFLDAVVYMASLFV